MPLKATQALHGLLTLTILPAAAFSEAAAQWTITAEVASARFWGGSRESNGSRSFHPYRPTLTAVGLERVGTRAGFGLQAYHASTSLALEGPDAIVAAKGALEVWGVEAEASVGLCSIAENVRMAAYAGPLVETWKLAGESSHTRAGFAAAIGMQVALGARWSGEIRAGGAVTASPFTDNDLDAGFHSSALWRRQVSGRLRYRL